MATSITAAVARILRAASYCRTSSKGGHKGDKDAEDHDRDNTSIERQEAANAGHIEAQGWTLTRHYVDEAKSGSKEEGRDAFQKLIRDAKAGLFDIVVVFDIKRFSRDGADIVRNATTLRTEYGIHVVDTKNQFDTRDRRKTLINYVHAGVSEQERLDIMERMIGGRIRRAQQGLPWTGNRPFGRGYRSTGKNQGEWYVTERGEALRELLTRYANGESLRHLAPQHGFSTAYVVLNAVRTAQLAGNPYVATFNTPELEIHDLQVEVPSIPPVITPELEKRVRQRMEHNRSWNKEDLRKYLLSGYVFCDKCGNALTSARSKGHVYYRHHYDTARGANPCGFVCVPGAILEPQALGYLYRFFLDQPAFDEAIRAALPTDDDRAALVADIDAAERQLTSVGVRITNVVNAIAEGGKLAELLDKQNELSTHRTAATARLAELRDSLAGLPDPELVRRQTTALRLQLTLQHLGKDWREAGFDDVRRFLRHLFGDNTKKTGLGIFVRRDEGKRWVLSFRGNVAFDAEVVNGHRRTKAQKELADQINKHLQGQLDREVAALRKKFFGEAGLQPPGPMSSAR